ncbi:50S ribosomal protein L19 [Patescibacteria group bacterium]|nr:50S ribosomal protein L19 [Patescibacteria group bacterium]
MNNLILFNSKNIGIDKFDGMKPGWTVKVFQKIKEGEKTRIQAFEGIVMSRKHKKESGATITFRKVFGGIGVEKTFPIYLPTIDKVEIIKKTKVRRAKLYYLKNKSAREIRRKTKVEQITS